MFKKEYFFVFIIIGLSIAYAVLSLIVFLTRGRWITIANKKIAVGAMIVTFTAILNYGNLVISQEVSPDPVPIYTTLMTTPTPTETPEPHMEYGVVTIAPTIEPLPEYGIVTIAPTPPNVKYGIVSLGDVNSDGEVDIVDGLLIAQYYVDLKPPNFNTMVADVDCTGKIDIVDALLVAQIYVGLIKEFPPCEDNA